MARLCGVLLQTDKSEHFGFCAEYRRNERVAVEVTAVLSPVEQLAAPVFACQHRLGHGVKFRLLIFGCQNHADMALLKFSRTVAGVQLKLAVDPFNDAFDIGDDHRNRTDFKCRAQHVVTGSCSGNSPAPHQHLKHQGADHRQCRKCQKAHPGPFGNGHQHLGVVQADKLPRAGLVVPVNPFAQHQIPLAVEFNRVSRGIKRQNWRRNGLKPAAELAQLFDVDHAQVGGGRAHVQQPGRLGARKYDALR